MKLVVKFLVLIILVGGFLFARSEEKGSRSSQKKIRNDYYVVQDHSNKAGDQLDRKRVHKRRRKIRKPIKGLR